MRMLLRLAVRGFLGLLVLLAVMAPLCLTKVDTRSSAGRPFSEETKARLAAWSGTAASSRVTGELRAGFGKAKLTPTLGAAVDAPERGEFTALPLAGYGSRQGRPATGVHDDVWVKAVAFSVGGQTGVVVAADALILPREVSEAAVERLHAQFGLDRRNVYFGATHTHCSLGGWGEGFVGEAFAGGFRPGARVWMATQLAAAAAAAITNLSPASVGRASFEAPDFIRNRLVGDRGVVDPQFSLLEIVQEGGSRAVIGSFSAHATVLSGDTMDFSGDYPGFWQRALEAKGVGMAMFLAGGVGSHAPKPPVGGMDGARRMGEALADRASKALTEVTPTNRIAWSMATLDVALPELQARITDGVRVRPWLARRMLPVHAETWLQAWRIGDSLLLSAPCDYSGELALDLKALGHTKALHAVVTSFNGDYVGYDIPAKYYHLDGYEPRTMSFFGPQLPVFFDELLRGLVLGSAK